MTFWDVYNHVARNWYELEHGQVERHNSWYHPAMIFLECLAWGWEVQRALDFIKPLEVSPAMMLDTCYRHLVATMQPDQRIAIHHTEYRSGSRFCHKLYRTAKQEVFIQECFGGKGYFERHRFTLVNTHWEGGSHLIPGSHSSHIQRDVLTWPELPDYE